MGNFLKKGKKANLRKIIKQTDKKVKEFNTILMLMNHVYYQLKDRTDLTKDNIDEEIKKISNYPFTEIQLNYLKTDLLYEGKDT